MAVIQTESTTDAGGRAEAFRKFVHQEIREFDGSPFYESPDAQDHGLPTQLFVFIHGVLSNADCWRDQHAWAIVQRLEAIPNCLFFAYESRPFHAGGNDETVPRLTQTLHLVVNLIRSRNRNGPNKDIIPQIAIFCHSNGGLLLRSYLEIMGRRYLEELAGAVELRTTASNIPFIRLIVFVAVPEGGGKGIFGFLAYLLHYLQIGCWRLSRRLVTPALARLVRRKYISSVQPVAGVNAITDELRFGNRLKERGLRLATLRLGSAVAALPFPHTMVRIVANGDSIAEPEIAGISDSHVLQGTHFLERFCENTLAAITAHYSTHQLSVSIGTTQFLLVRTNEQYNRAVGFTSLMKSTGLPGSRQQEDIHDVITRFAKLDTGRPILAIAGANQAGKSRVLAWAARNFAVNFLNSLDLPPDGTTRPTNPPAFFIPLSFSLPAHQDDVTRANPGTLADLMIGAWVDWANKLCGPGKPIDAQRITEYLQHHKALIFLDSLDEFIMAIPGLSRQLVVESVVSLAAKYPRARIIVSFRSEPTMPAGGPVTIESLFRLHGETVITETMDLIPEDHEGIRAVIARLKGLNSPGTRIAEFIDVIRKPIVLNVLKDSRSIDEQQLESGGIEWFLGDILDKAFSRSALEGHAPRTLQARLDHVAGGNGHLVRDVLALLGFLCYASDKGSRYFRKAVLVHELGGIASAEMGNGRLRKAVTWLGILFSADAGGKVAPEHQDILQEGCIARIFRDAFTELDPESLVCTHDIWLTLFTARFYALAIQEGALEFLGDIAFSPVITNLAGEALRNWQQPRSLVKDCIRRSEKEGNPLYALNMVALYAWSRNPNPDRDSIQTWIRYAQVALAKSALVFNGLFVLNALIFRWSRAAPTSVERRVLDDGLRRLFNDAATGYSPFVGFALRCYAVRTGIDTIWTELDAQRLISDILAGKTTSFSWNFGPSARADHLQERTLQAALCFLVRMVERGLYPDCDDAQERRVSTLRIPVLFIYLSALADTIDRGCATLESLALLERVANSPLPEILGKAAAPGDDPEQLELCLSSLLKRVRSSLQAAGGAGDDD